MILHVLTLCAFAVATTEFILVGLLPEIAADLSVSLPVAGFLVTAYMLVVTVGGPAGAIVTSRLPRRGLLMGTMALAVASAALSSLAGTYGVLLIARLGSALAQALFVAVASQVAMLVVPPGVDRPSGWLGATWWRGVCADDSPIDGQVAGSVRGGTARAGVYVLVLGITGR